ncbi:MAG: porin family protein [Gemmatimonadota bacterium]|nr:MAG: porin family protein [Gemmatimonadota bacterium]
MKRFGATIVGLAFLAVAASADAQVAQNEFQVAAYGGYQSFGGGSGLKAGPTLGGSASYYVTENIGIGIWTDLTFGEVDGSKFPIAALSFGDSTTLNVINQPADIWNYGLNLNLRLPLGGSLVPYAVLGGGGYRVFLDPQQWSGVASETGLIVRLDFGVNFAATEALGFQLAVTDHWYPDWGLQDDFFKLYPVSDQPVGLGQQRKNVINDRFPELNPDTNALSNSVHNFSIVAGVTLVPGR